MMDTRSNEKPQRMTAPHPIQRRYLDEQIVRLRRVDEEERYASSQRQGRIDPNPHQIDSGRNESGYWPARLMDI